MLNQKKENTLKITLIINSESFGYLIFLLTKYYSINTDTR